MNEREFEHKIERVHGKLSDAQDELDDLYNRLQTAVAIIRELLYGTDDNHEDIKRHQKFVDDNTPQPAVIPPPEYDLDSDNLPF